MDSDNPINSLRDAWDNTQDLASLWDAIQAAPELELLPIATYDCIVYGGEMTKSSKGKDGYSVTFEVIAGPHAGRKVRHSIWITSNSLTLARRDLAKLGIASENTFGGPLPRPLHCRARIGQWDMGDGRVFNKVQSFEVLPGGPPPSPSPVHARPPAPAPAATAQAPASIPEAHATPTPATPAPAALYDHAFPPDMEG